MQCPKLQKLVPVLSINNIYHNTLLRQHGLDCNRLHMNAMGRVPSQACPVCCRLWGRPGIPGTSKTTLGTVPPAVLHSEFGNDLRLYLLHAGRSTAMVVQHTV